MMTTDDLLKQGIAAFKAGRKAEARELLLQLTEQDERNEMAWLWLSGAVDTDEERLICLENVLAINPNNGMAGRGIEALRKSSPELFSPREEEATLQPSGETKIDVESRLAREETTVNEILQQAVIAIKAGEEEKGKQLLIEVLEQDEDNESAWLWMTRCVAELDVKRECFERVLEINPDNKHAIKGLKRLDALSKTEISTPPKHRKAPRKQNRLIISIGVGILVVVIVLVGVWWAVGSGSTQSEPTEVTSVIYENLRALEREDIKSFMATLHKQSPGYEQTEQAVRPLFDAYDLEYELVDLKVIKVSDQEARIAFTQITRKASGPEFRDNKIKGVHILRKSSDASWKIYETQIESIDYLD
jgi:tetratricopeptide (TPR) repeat protein